MFGYNSLVYDIFFLFVRPYFLPKTNNEERQQKSTKQTPINIKKKSFLHFIFRSFSEKKSIFFFHPFSCNCLAHHFSLLNTFSTRKKQKNRPGGNVLLSRHVSNYDFLKTNNFFSPIFIFALQIIPQFFLLFLF